MKRDSETFPNISKSLLDSLEDTFPAKDFGPDVTYETLMFHYGQRAVVNFLKHQYEIQNENILT